MYKKLVLAWIFENHIIYKDKRQEEIDPSMITRKLINLPELLKITCTTFAFKYNEVAQKLEDKLRQMV